MLFHDPVLVFVLLLTGHGLGDFAWQSGDIAIGKGSFAEPYKTVPWYHWMLGHASTHAFIVAAVTGLWWLGVFELVLHFFIDTCKCCKIFGVGTDQALHFFCKLVWMLLWLMWKFPAL